MPDGMPDGPNTTFAGSELAVMSMPIDFSSCWTIASCVVRVALPAVHVKRNLAGRPEQVHVGPTDVPYVPLAKRV